MSTILNRRQDETRQKVGKTQVIGQSSDRPIKERLYQNRRRKANLFECVAGLKVGPDALVGY
ncbi:MAG TPA: hypothetical protein VHX65_16460 [Pirellulales bacterium]|nr:hypothetical protein [Pirellulales bacterium]